MTKAMYRLANKVETNIDEYPVLDISPLERKKMQRKLFSSLHRKRRYQKAAAAACVIMAGTILMAGPFRREVQAAAQSISYRVADYLGLNTDLAPYEQVIGQSVEKDGITIMLNSVIINGDELVVSSLQSESQPISERSGMMSAEVYINGKLMETGSSGSSRRIDENTLESVMEYGLEGVDTTQKMDMKLIFRNHEKASEQWKFAFSANGEALSKATGEAALNYSFSLPGGEKVELTRLTNNDMGQKIYYETKDLDYSKYDILLKGTDNLGNPVEFSLRSGTKDKGLMKIEPLYSSLSSEATELILTPYVALIPELDSRVKQSASVEAEVTDGDQDNMVVIGDENGSAKMEYKPAGEAFTISLP